ncbi:MAG TPA: PAS domain S-box protein [Azospira sp.]|nr:PAS domain S-box protein [Azospira sp.]HNN46113.1 PAS domain S-box protein [Azospira sp.]
MRLLPKIVLAVVLPVMAGAGAVLYVFAGSWQQTLERELVESARRELVARVDTVPAGLQAGRDTLRLLARTPLLATGNVPAIRRVLREWGGLSADFEGFSFVDGDGWVYPPEGDRVSVRDRSYYPKLAAGEEVLAQPLISRLSGQPVLLITVPVRDDAGKLVGTLGGTILLNRFFARTVSDARVQTGHFLLLDSRNRLLAGGLDGEGDSLRVPDVTREPVTLAVIDAIAGALRDEELNAELVVRVGEDVMRVLHAPVPAVSWRLVYAQPESSLLAPLVEARRLAWQVIAGAALAALIVGWLLFRLIVRPLRTLADAQALVQRGDLAARATIAGSDELAELGESFNRMAESLQRSEGMFRSVFEAAPYAVTLTRLSDGTFLDVNPAYEHSTGRSRDEVIGRAVTEIGSLNDAQLMKQLAQRLLEKGRLDNIEMRSLDPDGQERWTLFSSSLVSLDGEPVALSMSVIITQQKLTEQALRDSEAGFTALFDLAPIPFAYAQDADGYRGTHWNEAWYKAFGYLPAEAENFSGADFGLWVDAQDRQTYLNAALDEGGVAGLSVLMRRKNGDVRQIELHGRFISVGRRRLLMTAYLDVTDARRAEAALRAREMWLRSLFEVSPVAVLVIDLQGNIRECNQRFADMLQHVQQDLVGRCYFDFVHPSQQALARRGVGSMLTDPSVEVFSAERTYLRKDGSGLLGLLSARRLPGQSGGEDVILAIISDISELRHAEAQRIESETKLQAVFNASPVAMIVSDVRRNYASVAANDAWERQFLRRREQVMGMTGAEMGLWASIPERDEVLARIASEGSISGFETRLVRGDGVELLCRVSARKVLAGDAELLVMVQEDVSALRKTEASLQTANRELGRQLALADAVARAQSNFIADAAATGAFESLLADLLRLAESEYGFIGEILQDAAGQPYLKTHAITNLAWDDASRRYYDEHAAQGLEFHNLKTLFGAAIVSGEPVIANDPPNDPRRGGLPPGHPAMTAFLGLPIRVGGQLVAMAGVANRNGGYDFALVSWLQPLLLTIGQMVEARRATLARLDAEAALRELNEALDGRVRERTVALARTNEELSNALDTLQRAQGDLVRSEKLAALGALVAGVAHELNTPIGNSVTVASTLVDNSESFASELHKGLKRSTLNNYVDSSRRAAELLLANLQRAAGLVSSFKQVAVDQTSEQRRRFEVAEVVNEIMAMLHPQLRKLPIEILRDIVPGLVLDSYPGPFGQVIANLVNNATLHAFTDGRERGVIRIGAHALSDGVEVVVSDDGVGIPPDHMDRIFDPFFTTRLGQGGSGLGLNIVYNIVTGMLGGRIRVDSKPGEGAAFIVTLPLAAPLRDVS